MKGRNNTRQTLRKKKETRRGRAEVKGPTAITCPQDGMKIDFSICSTRQFRYSDGCIGCGRYGG